MEHEQKLAKACQEFHPNRWRRLLQEREGRPGMVRTVCLDREPDRRERPIPQHRFQVRERVVPFRHRFQDREQERQE